MASENDEFSWDFAFTYERIGNAALQVKNYTTVRDAFEELLEIREQRLLGQPDNAELLINAARAAKRLGQTCQSLQDWLAARKAFEKAIQHAQPAVEAARKASETPSWSLGITYSLLGNTAIDQREFAQAVRDFEKGIEVDSDQPRCYNGLAWLLATCSNESVRNGPQAIELATKACEITEWEDSNFLDTLAAAYAEAGKFDEAVKWETKAIEHPEAFDQAAFEEMQARLKLFQAGKPYHEPPPGNADGTVVE